MEKVCGFSFSGQGICEERRRRTVLEPAFLCLWQAIILHDPLCPILTPSSPFPLLVLFPPVFQEGGQGVKGGECVDVFGGALAGRTGVLGVEPCDGGV